MGDKGWPSGSGARAPPRDKRGWLAPVGERYEVLEATVEMTPVSGLEPFNKALLACANTAIATLEEHGYYNVGMAIAMLDRMCEAHHKAVDALVAEKVKDRAHQVASK